MKNFISTFILIFLLIGNKFYSQVKVPMVFKEDKTVFLSVKVNDSKEPLLFFFDTGATTPLISEEVARRLNIKPDITEKVAGASGEKEYRIANNQKLTIGDKVVLDDISFMIDDISRLNSSIGIKFDGIIGYDLLEKFVTEIDFDQKVMTIYNSGVQPKKDGYVAHPFTWTEEITIPQYDITFQLENGSSYTGRVLFDSGASLNLLVNSKFATQNNILDQLGKKAISSSNDLSGSGEIIMSKIKSLQFFDHQFDSSMVAHFSTDKTGVNAMPNFLGILGAEIINRFNIILDYKNQQIYFKPNSIYKKAITTTISPFKLMLKDDKIVINHVVKESDAYNKGFESGDVIVSIDGKEINDIFEARKLLNTPNAKRKVTGRKQNNETITKTIKIQKL